MKITKRQLRRIIREQVEEKEKFVADDEIEDTPYVYYGNKRYPKTSKLFPGDVIEVINPNEPKKHKELAQVKHVRNFNDYTISAIYFSGDFFGTKEILTVDQKKEAKILFESL